MTTPGPADELERFGRDLHRLTRELRTLHLNPLTELETILDAIDKLTALGPRLDAIAAAVGTDTATAVANATAPLNQQIADLQNAATQKESDTSAVADTLTAKVAALEPLVGISAPAPAAEQPQGEQPA